MLHLLYHEIRATETRYSYVTEATMFERHVDLYARLHAEESRHLRPEITFDDGHISNVELAAPILQSRGLKAHFFITAGWTGAKPNYMGWNDLKDLHGAGHSIGAHGWSHKLLTHCSDAELETELDRTRLTLEDRLGVAITTLSLPGGRYDRRVLTACGKTGYKQIFTSVPKAETAPLGTLVGRFNIRGNMQPEWIEQLLDPGSGVLRKLEQQQRVKDALKSLLGDTLYARLWRIVNRSEPGLDETADSAE